MQYRVFSVIVVCLVVAGCASDPASDAENRAFDGQGNNLDDMDRGATFTPLMRMAPNAYADGIAMPARMDMPSPRALSNALCSQSANIVNDRDLSDWVWQWGQFIDHDITLSEFMQPIEPLPIAIPAGDPMFDPDGTGAHIIPLDRSVYDPESGTGVDRPRQQINQLTAFIDGSQVYGSSEQRAQWLRLGRGGRLKTSAGDLLPFNDGSQVNAGPGGLPSHDTSLFVAGDIRANEQPGLTAVHTLFVREHNRIVLALASEHPDWNDEQLYQRGRKVVGALIQVITYNEFLPALLGPHAPRLDDAAYDPEVDPTIANEFANACYRVGHTMISPMLQRLDDNGQLAEVGPLRLRDGFFNPQVIQEGGGIGPLLAGLAAQRMQEIDGMVIDELRNFLFAQPGQGGFDLAALNMQRGRDHGLPDYNTLRESFGLARITDVEGISTNPAVHAMFTDVYEDLSHVDPWIGALWEDHLSGASVGELIATVVADQFERLRDGDRLWYARDPAFSEADIAEIENTQLSHIILRNTTISGVRDNVFRITD
jgi:hypothetical protein